MARVLIVEDDGDLQRLLSIALNKEKHEVHYAFNGREGYDKSVQFQPDVILLDLMMPVLNGFEVLKLLAANALTRDIPVVVMTAHSGDKVREVEQALQSKGVRAYLKKPFELGEMRALIKRLLAQFPRSPEPPAEIEKGGVRMDIRYRTVWLEGKLAATLAPARAKLLQALMVAPGPVSRAELMKAVWGEEEGKDAALEKAVQRLREDLGEHGKRVQTASDGYELIG